MVEVCTTNFLFNLKSWYNATGNCLCSIFHSTNNPAAAFVLP